MAPCVGPCQFMGARHGTISPTLRAGVHFFGGGGGWRGGGGGVGFEPPPMGGGGSPVGALSGMAEDTRRRPRPLQGRTWDSAGGTLLYGMLWYGMVRYGTVRYGTVRYGTVRYSKVRYGMVWYGMVWHGMVWYGMVWYGMVWYGMVWYGMVWYGVVVFVVVLSTCRREKLLDTLSLGRGQGSSQPELRWPCGRQRRPRGGGRVGEGCVRAGRREGPPVGVTLEPSPAAGGRVTGLVRSGGRRGAGRGPWGLEGKPGSAVTPRLARTSCRGGRSSCAPARRRRALAREPSRHRARGGGGGACLWVIRLLVTSRVLWCGRPAPGGASSRARRPVGRVGTLAGAHGAQTQGYMDAGALHIVLLLFPGACPWFPCAGVRAAWPAGG